MYVNDHTVTVVKCTRFLILQEKECWLLSEEEQLLLERVDSSKLEAFRERSMAGRTKKTPASSGVGTNIGSKSSETKSAKQNRGEKSRPDLLCDKLNALIILMQSILLFLYNSPLRNTTSDR